nr:hypothetical protein GCM10020063_036950 [Dactylosporangium thailandense]
MTDPRLVLQQLLDGALVWVGVAGEEGTARGGSGVRIAPGLVLTCAHVVPATGQPVRVGRSGRYRSGTVLDRAPNAGTGRLWPYPDLALIEVDDDADHPCAWLAELPKTVGAPVMAFGHSAILDVRLEPFYLGGTVGGFATFGAGELWQFTENEIGPGMSGGPVLDLGTGAVCGLVTTTRAENSNRGGFFVPTSGLRGLHGTQRGAALRRHDRFHARDDRWTRARAVLPPTAAAVLVPNWIKAEEEAELIGALADWPEHTNRTSADGAGLRDRVYGLLDEGISDTKDLQPLLRLTDDLAAEAAGSDLGRRLYDWTTAVAARIGVYGALTQRRHRPRPAAEAGQPHTVVVVIRPGMRTPDQYQLDVWIHRSDGLVEHAYCDSDAIHTLDDAKALVCTQLRVIMRALEGNAGIEFAVPIELFGEAFDELVPAAPTTSLGRKYRVVLRDLERIEDRTSHTDWRRRWKRLHDASGTEPHWLPCVGIPEPTHFAAELELEADVAMIALRRPPDFPPSYEALKVALDAGVPVAVWRRGSCPEHDAGIPDQPCTGARFQSAFTAERTVSQTMPLPDLIRRLRNRVVHEPGHGCRDVVLLWDDPSRLPALTTPFVAPAPRHPQPPEQEST